MRNIGMGGQLFFRVLKLNQKRKLENKPAYHTCMKMLLHGSFQQTIIMYYYTNNETTLS